MDNEFYTHKVQIEGNWVRSYGINQSLYSPEGKVRSLELCSNPTGATGFELVAILPLILSLEQTDLQFEVFIFDQAGNFVGTM